MAQEKNFENKVKKFLKDNGCWFVKYWGGGQFTKAGIPDILCCCNGCFIGIEVKADKGRPSELQLMNLKKIDEAGGFAVLLYPDDFEMFKDLIEMLMNDSIEYAVIEQYFELKERWMNYGTQ